MATHTFSLKKGWGRDDSNPSQVAPSPHAAPQTQAQKELLFGGSSEPTVVF